MIHHDGFREILKAYDVSLGTLWRAMKRHTPNLGLHVLVEFKRELTPQQIGDRYDKSHAWSVKGVKPLATGVTIENKGADTRWHRPPPHNSDEYPLDWLTPWAKRVIYVDAKRIYICPHSHKVYGLKGSESIVIPDPRLLDESWVIHYYSAVNYHCGGVLLQFVSGTDGPGYIPEKTYLVRQKGWRVVCPRGQAHGVLNKGHAQNFIPAGALIKGMQSQFTVASVHGCRLLGTVSEPLLLNIH